MTTDSREQQLELAWGRMNDDERDKYVVLLSMGKVVSPEGMVFESDDLAFLRDFEDKMIEKYVKTNDQ